MSKKGVLLQVDQGSLAYGHVALLDEVDFVLQPGERVCLVGRNGTGKSTLLNVLSCEATLDSGVLRITDGVRVAKLAQEVPADEQASVYQVVARGLGDHSTLLSEYHASAQALADHPDDQQAMTAFERLQEKVEAAGAWDGSQRIDAAISRLGLPSEQALSDCSGGVRRRAMLGQALVSEPDVLLLDEPTNHLDIPSIEALEAAIATYSGAVVFITHDRTFADALATRIVELDRGILRSYPGSFAQYLSRKEQELEVEAQANAQFDKELAAEEAWIREGIKARRTRNEGRVRRLKAMRQERAERRERTGQVSLAVDGAERSGKVVAELEGVRFGYEQTPIIRHCSTAIVRGDRVGIVGPNGSGKSTLLKLLLGQLQPDGGTVRTGTKLQLAYFDQEREQLDESLSVVDNVVEGSDTIEVAGRRRHVIGYLGDFLFPAARARSPVSTLSGGERNRLLLAKLFAKPANLLVLDEPTNDLDVETLELLESLLSEFEGTLLLVSHDRSFLDATVTSTLVIDPEGHVHDFVGGYSEAMEQFAKLPIARKAAAPAVRSEVVKPAEAEKPARARKLGYREQRELAALPEKIESLEAQLGVAQAQVSDPSFYKQPEAEVAQQLKALADLEQELETAFARWEALENPAEK